MHESNSFNPEETTLEDFRFRAEEDWGAGNTEVSGMLHEGRNAGFSFAPILYCSAMPKGPVSADTFENLSKRLLSGIRALPKLDAVLLALHGAMYTVQFPHADEEIVRRVRAAIGPEVPLVVTHDFHANIPPTLGDLCDALVVYQQNPHIDTRQRGARAASILAGILGGTVRPTQAIVKPPLLWNITFQNTFREPLQSITQASMDLEQTPGVLAASVAGGYQYNDVPQLGPSVVVVTDNAPEQARQHAQTLSDMMCSKRNEIVLNLPDARTAVQDAMRGPDFPVALFDTGDNIGGGSAGNETTLLQELVRQQARGWVMVLFDPRAVERAKQVGAGGSFDEEVGGEPVPIKGVVRSLHRGRYIEPEVRHGGQRYWDMGHAAVIEVDGSTPDELNLLIVTARRSSPDSLHQLISCGIYPERQKILVAKGTVAPRAAYEPVAARIVLVDTPGFTAVNPERFSFQKVRPGLLEPASGLDR